MAESHESERRTGLEIGGRTWIAGGVGGLAGGAVMGVMLQLVMTPVITAAIPALYGLNGLAAGWIAHLFHSLVFGLLFAAALSTSPLARYADAVTTSAGLGLAYGALLWIVAAGVVMPIWLGAVGFPGAPPLPNLNPMSLVGHLVYGVVLGVVFPLVRGR